MSVIIDIVIVAVIALFVFIGLKRGFVRELVSLFSFVIALAVAFFLSGVGSTFIYDTVIHSVVHDSISSSVSENVSNEAEAIIMEIPDEFVDAGKSIGVDIENIVRTNMGATVEETANNVANTVSRDVARPVVSSFIRVVLFILIFILVKLLIDWIGRLLNIVSILPVVHGANKILGGVIGFLRGLVLAVVVCYAIILVVDVRDNGILGITKETVENSYLFNLIANIVR